MPDKRPKLKEYCIIPDFWGRDNDVSFENAANPEEAICAFLKAQALKPLAGDSIYVQEMKNGYNYKFVPSKSKFVKES